MNRVLFSIKSFEMCRHSKKFLASLFLGISLLLVGCSNLTNNEEKIISNNTESFTENKIDDNQTNRELKPADDTHLSSQYEKLVKDILAVAEEINNDEQRQLAFENALSMKSLEVAFRGSVYSHFIEVELDYDEPFLKKSDE